MATPFTVDDAVASINKEVDPATKSEIAGNFTSIKTASKVDDTTLQIATNGPQPSLLVALSYLPMMSAKWLAETPPEQIALTTNGTGPYMMDGEWKKGVSIDLKRFDGYWGAKPQVTAVNYKFLAENQTRLASLLTGESDYMMNVLPEYIPQIEEKGLKVAAGPSFEFPLIRLTSFKGPMQKTDMRLAANYAVDKQGIVDSLYGGYATVPNGQALNPTYGGYNPDLTAYPYDPAKAKELLKSAGYNNEVIQLYGETGRWLKDSEVVTAVADQLRAVGMNIELKIVALGGIPRHPAAPRQGPGHDLRLGRQRPLRRESGAELMDRDHRPSERLRDDRARQAGHGGRSGSHAGGPRGTAA